MHGRRDFAVSFIPSWEMLSVYQVLLASYLLQVVTGLLFLIAMMLLLLFTDR